MKKLLLLELVFLVTAVFLVILQLSHANLFNLFFLMAVVFSAIVAYYENREHKLLRGLLVGMVAGFLWAFEYLAVLMLLSVGVIMDQLTSEAGLITQLNDLKLGNLSTNIAGYTPGQFLVFTILALLVIVTIVGGISGLVTSLVLRYKKNSGKRK